MNLASRCSSADVVLVSAAPLDPRFSSGFAARHAAFASAVAARHRTEIVYVHDGDGAAFEDISQPAGITKVHVVDGSQASGRDDLRIPRGCVARKLRWSSSPEAPLLITLTANVAHIALGSARVIAALEEGWERRPPRAQRFPERRSLLFLAELARYRSLYRRVGRCAQNVVAITPRERHHFSHFMPKEKITIVPFGVDIEYFSPIPTADRDIDVLIVGAANRQDQRTEDLVHELQRHPATRTARCTVAGALPRPAVSALASETVHIAGYVPDVRPLYARAKVVAIPTFTDVGIKTTMLQAWAMERPVVTSRSVLAAAKHSAALSQFAVDTIAEMVPAIARLLDHPEESEHLGLQARGDVLAHHEARQSAQQFASLVSEVLASTRGPDGGRPR